MNTHSPPSSSSGNTLKLCTPTTTCNISACYGIPATLDLAVVVEAFQIFCEGNTHEACDSFKKPLEDYTNCTAFNNKKHVAATKEKLCVGGVGSKEGGAIV